MQLDCINWISLIPGLLPPIEVCEAALLFVEERWFFPEVIFRHVSPLPVLAYKDRFKWKVTHHSSAASSSNSFSIPEWIPFDPWDLVLLVLPVYSAANSYSFSVWSYFPLLMTFYTGCLLGLQSLGKVSDMLKRFCFAFTVCPIVAKPSLLFLYSLYSGVNETTFSFLSTIMFPICLLCQIFLEVIFCKFLVKRLRRAFLLKKRVQFVFCGRVIRLLKWIDPPLFYSNEEHPFCLFCSRHQHTAQ